MRYQFQKTVRLFMLLLDIALLVAVFFLVWTTIYSTHIPVPFFRRGNYVLYLLYAFLLTAFILLMKGHRIGSLRVLEIQLSQSIAILLANAALYFQISLLSYKLVSLTGFLIMTVIQLLLMAFWALLSNRLYFSLYAPQEMAFIYDNPAALRIAEKLNTMHERYHISAYYDICNSCAEAENAVLRYSGIVLAIRDASLQERFINLCYSRNINLYVVPGLADVVINGAKDVNAMDTPLLFFRNGRLTAEERIYKRTFDFICSLIGIALVSPVMLLTAFAIWLYDRKPVIYTQDRLTRDGRTFRLYKFRSMVPNAEKNGACLAAENDERITPVGRFIRNARIDELPQLFNVLIGDMSLVGPRPERPEIALEYEQTLPEFRYRLNVKAGLTGNAQVHGNYDTSSSDKLLMDLMYIENYTFLRDLSLLFQTLRIILMPEKAAGVKQTLHADNREHKTTSL